MKKIKNKDNIITLVLLIILVSVITIGKVVADSISAADIPMKDNSSTTIKTRLDTLASKPQPTTCPTKAVCKWKKSWSNVVVGDYVQMTPTKTSYELDSSKTGYTLFTQTINPSELKLWRVIRKNANGTIDLVSEYVSSAGIYFKGTAGYANYVGYLNTLASQYANTKYTTSTRYMGYSSQTQTITNTAAFNGSSTTAPWACSTGETCNPVESTGGGDTLYTTDTNLVTTATGSLVACKVGTTTPTTYWLASRFYEYSSSKYFSFYGRYVDSIVSHSTKCTGICLDFSSVFSCRYDGCRESYGLSGYSLRPIVTLKSGLSVSNALGTSDDPYVLP